MLKRPRDQVRSLSQPSTPGFSLLGDRLPDARSVDPRLNLNNQDWSLPVVMAGQTSSMRYTQALSSDINPVAHAMRQRLNSDDRIAFPFGLYDQVTYNCAPCDRKTSGGKFSIWDYRSEGERRTSDALDLSIQDLPWWPAWPIASMSGYCPRATRRASTPGLQPGRRGQRGRPEPCACRPQSDR